MEINLSLQKRIERVKSLINKNNEELNYEFYELMLLYERTDKSILNKRIIEDVNLLKNKFEMNKIKEELNNSLNTERKKLKADDFSVVCSLIKNQKFDEARKRFYDKTK